MAGPKGASAATTTSGSHSTGNTSTSNTNEVSFKESADVIPNSHGGINSSNGATRKRKPYVVAVEEDDDDFPNLAGDDFIPGPPKNEEESPLKYQHNNSSTEQPKDSMIKRIFGKHSPGSPKSPGRMSISLSSRKSANMNNSERSMNSGGGAMADPFASRDHEQQETEGEELDLSLTEHRIRGNGILASRADLGLAPEEFAAGCNLLQAAASGNLRRVEELLVKRPHHVNFRDYDRRTALHVAASEGHIEIVKFLIQAKKAKINRSDRWGGSPLDDAHRHRHHEVVTFLRNNGAITGSGNRSTNLITAAAEGDVDEVKMLITSVQPRMVAKIVSKGDYDKRTPLHLAASEGHAEIVKLLCKANANPNAEDRWGSRPLDDAMKSEQEECIRILKEFGARPGENNSRTFYDDIDKSQTKREQDNLKVDFDELEMVDRIGSGAFGEIFKCRWRGTLVAAKCIKSAKIRQEWINKKALESIEKGEDVDDAVRTMDEAELDQSAKEEALNDFRQEISVLKSLRHPHIVLLLAFSTTENYEVMISELMECSLLDVFKAHQVHGTRLAKKQQISYAIQLARGMNYLHNCKPPIVHRDLKPANLLLDHTGVLKISDFGLAKVRPDPKKKQGKQKGRFMTGETGSYRFMAPEVYRHEEYGETVDIYSYAMIFFYLLDGRPPWPTLNGLEAVRRASDEGDRPIIPRHWDQRLQAVLMECWDENRRARPSFNRILEILDNYSKDVFHTDITKNSPPAQTGCNCTIL